MLRFFNVTRSFGHLARSCCLAALAVVYCGGPYLAHAGPRDDTLYWASGAEIESISPYFDFRPEIDVFSHLIWDRLFHRDPNSAAFKPHLATKLKWIGITTLEIDLRSDVVFHNGDKFTADDVVETIRRLKNPELGAPLHRAVEWIGKIEKLSPYRIRLDLTRPTPHALELLAGPLIIVPRAVWRSAPLDDNGQPNYRELEAVGSGPYRVTRIVPAGVVELERFRQYASGPKGRPAIGKIKFTTVADPSERLAQLLDGRLDWIGNLSKQTFERLEADGAPVQLASVPSARIAFLLMDRAGRNDEKSPFRDIRVRQAVAHAINREEIARQIFGPTSKILHALCYPAQTGCSQDVRRFDYDPGKSKKLLAAAGYGPAGGIRLIDQLNSAAQRLPGQPPQKQVRLRSIAADILSYRNHEATDAMALYLMAIGIDSRTDRFRSFETASLPLNRGSVDLAHMTWAAHGALDVAETLNPLFRNGSLDYCRDTEVNRWLDVAANTNDSKTRARAHANALKRLQDLVCVLPLFNYTTFHAYSRSLDFAPTLDDVARMYRFKWK